MCGLTLGTPLNHRYFHQGYRIGKKMEATIPLYIFEDPGWRRFGPLVSNRPIWRLRLGLESIDQRVKRLLGNAPKGFLPRKDLVSLLQEESGDRSICSLKRDGEVFLVNGRAVGILPATGLDSATTTSVWTDGPDVVAARIPMKTASKWLRKPKIDPCDYSSDVLLKLLAKDGVKKVKVEKLTGSLCWWPWELIHHQEVAIEDEFQRRGGGIIAGDVDHRAILVEEQRINIAEGARIRTGAILDATDGSIVIDKDATVMPGAIIMGPVAIGAGATIKAGAKIYGPTVIGPVCKIGGEVEECVFLGYSNKQHEGFLGHSLVGEWVNLGADTNNSDLKNNYSDVKVTIEGQEISTRSQFFGSIIGDHVKTAINSQLNTGTVIGLGTNLFGAGFPPKTIGAYRWGGAQGFEMTDFEKFQATAEKVMARRNIKLSKAMRELLKKLHEDALEGKI